MKRVFRIIWHELKRNYDVYLTMIVCAAIVVVDIFDVVKPSVVSSGILATLLLIAFTTLNSRRLNDELQKDLSRIQLSQSSLTFMKEWDNNDFAQKVTTAKRVSVLATSNYDFVNRNAEQLKELVKRGGQIRCVLIDPSSIETVRMAIARAYGASKEADYLIAQIKLTLQKLHEVALGSNKDNVQVKLIDYLPGIVMTMVDHQTSGGVMFVTIHGFDCPHPSLPCFTLHKGIDGKWFDFFQESFESIWSWPGAKSHNWS